MRHTNSHGRFFSNARHAIHARARARGRNGSFEASTVAPSLPRSPLTFTPRLPMTLMLPTTRAPPSQPCCASRQRLSPCCASPRQRLSPCLAVPYGQGLAWWPFLVVAGALIDKDGRVLLTKRRVGDKCVAANVGAVLSAALSN